MISPTRERNDRKSSHERPPPCGRVIGLPAASRTPVGSACGVSASRNLDTLGSRNASASLGLLANDSERFVSAERVFETTAGASAAIGILLSRLFSVSAVLSMNCFAPRWAACPAPVLSATDPIAAAARSTAAPAVAAFFTPCSAKRDAAKGQAAKAVMNFDLVALGKSAGM
jgi:hypothetical protein